MSAERIVLDTSYALSMVMGDETAPLSADQVVSADLIAPAIWPLEIANALLSNLKRKRLAQADATDVLDAVEGLDVKVLALPMTPRYAFVIAARHALTPYDAQYLELAAQQSCSLATKDAAMADAARRLGIAVID